VKAGCSFRGKFLNPSNPTISTAIDNMCSAVSGPLVGNFTLRAPDNPDGTPGTVRHFYGVPAEYSQIQCIYPDGSSFMGGGALTVQLF
jgi:hypothetical protein